MLFTAQAFAMHHFWSDFFEIIFSLLLKCFLAKNSQFEGQEVDNSLTSFLREV